MNDFRSDPESLARLLDRTLPPNQTTAPQGSSDPLVNMAVQLARIELPALPTEFLLRTEMRLLNAFDRQQNNRRVRHLNRQLWATRMAAAAALVLVFFGAGLSSVMANSLPGDPLYGIKRGYETLELQFATSDDARADVFVRQAERRADEALLLLRRSEFDPDVVAGALNAVSQADTLVRTTASASEKVLERAQNVTFTLDVVLQTAVESGLTTPSESAPLVTELEETVEQINQPLPQEPVTPVLSPTPTNTATVGTPVPTGTPPLVENVTQTPRGNRPDERTNTPRPDRTPEATRTPRNSTPQPTDCRGNSCNSAGRPGGQVNPTNPPGQTGGRDDNRPQPPGQGNPPANSGNDNANNGGGNNPPANQGGGNASGGGNPPDNPGQGNPPADPGGGNNNDNGNGGGSPPADPGNGGGSPPADPGNGGNNGNDNGGGSPPADPGNGGGSPPADPGNGGGNNGNDNGGGSPPADPGNGGGNDNGNGNGGGNGNGNG